MWVINFDSPNWELGGLVRVVVLSKFRCEIMYSRIEMITKKNQRSFVKFYAGYILRTNALVRSDVI